MDPTDPVEYFQNHVMSYFECDWRKEKKGK